MRAQSTFEGAHFCLLLTSASWQDGQQGQDSGKEGLKVQGDEDNEGSTHEGNEGQEEGCDLCDTIYLLCVPLLFV
jgi:hypothetical protein